MHAFADIALTEIDNAIDKTFSQIIALHIKLLTIYDTWTSRSTMKSELAFAMQVIKYNWA